MYAYAGSLVAPVVTLEDQVERLLDGLHVGLLGQPVVDELARFLVVQAGLDGL